MAGTTISYRRDDSGVITGRIFDRLAARGEAIAMFNLGALWERDIGDVADVTKAKTWYQRAATQIDAQAKAALKRLGP